jgi:hypothetical protein
MRLERVTDRREYKLVAIRVAHLRQSRIERPLQQIVEPDICKQECRSTKVLGI